MTDARSLSHGARPPLRALRQEPLLVDGHAAALQLRRRSATVRLPPDAERWVRAWLVCAHAALVGSARFGLDEPWTIPLCLDDVRTPRGAGDRARVRALLTTLTTAGVLLPAAGATPDGMVRLDRAIFTAHHAAIALDWPALVAACGAEPAALLTLRALAELIVPLDAWTAVPRRDLMAHTGYGAKQTRVALRRLAAEALIEVEGEVGETARYRFTSRAFGRPWAQAVPSLAPGAALVPPVAPGGAPEALPPSVAGGTAPADGLRVSVSGVTLTLAAGADFTIDAGLAARLELGADGRPTLRVVRSADVRHD